MEKNFTFDKNETPILALVILLSFSVLFGWVIGNTTLIQIHPTFAPMQFNTALGFFLLSVSFLFRKDFETLSLTLAYLCLALSGVTFLQYILSINLGIDELFMKGYVTVKTSHPGRMAPNTAICFITLSLSFLLKNKINHSYYLSLICITLAILALLGYMIHTEEMYSWGRLTKMAFHTSICFLLLSIIRIKIIICDSHIKLDPWKITTYFVAISGIVITTIVWEDITHRNKINARNEFKSLVTAEEAIVEARIESYKQVLLSGLAFINSSEKITYLEWQTFVATLDISENLPGLSGLGIIDIVPSSTIEDYTKRIKAEGVPNFSIHPKTNNNPKYVIRYVEPSSQNYQAIGLDISFENNRRTAAEQAIKTGRSQATQPITLVQDQKRTAGFLVLLPSYKNREMNGFIYVPFTAQNFFSSIRKKNNNLNMKVYTDTSLSTESIVYDETIKSVSSDNEYIFRKQIEFFEREWVIEWQANADFINQHKESSASIVAVIGIIFTTLLSGLLYELTQRYGLSAREKNEASERLSLALKSAELGTWDWNINTDTIIVNDRAANMLGYTVEELSDKFSNWLDMIHPEDLEQTQNELQKHLSGESRYYDVDFRIKAKHEKWKWIRSIGKVVEFDNSLKPSRATGTFLDISDIKTAEQKLISAKVIAEEANRAKTDFINHVSHEIRTPLTGVVSMSELIYDNVENEKIKEYSEIINESADMILQMIEELLDISKIESDKLELEKIKISLFEIVENTIKLLDGISSKNAVSLNLKFDETIPEYLYGDPLRIRQILINLVGNAIKFSKAGGAVDISIELDGNKSSEELKYIFFKISDYGIGIDKNQLEHIFDSFVQAHRSTARFHGGSGLGLTICKQLVELMGGTISVESELGKGSTFTVYIPFCIK